MITDNRKNMFYRWLAWHLPSGVVYWATIRLLARSTTVLSDVSPSEIYILQALRAWEHEK